eukprot:TRINITY_DN34563_c1_g1_i1.p1 TRINITY_DN34563_c1_g1~~TRINITY_DN34563_c1_g1_i1.p1  ORF type:complete len:118 (-),score=9.31 TRINITY_DN34563_c1_g1_i1:7-360(-)
MCTVTARRESHGPSRAARHDRYNCQHSDHTEVTVQLLALGQNPTAVNVQSVLKANLPDWRENPRQATGVLSQLARRKRAQTAVQVLTAMNMHGLQSNTFHYNAAISACEKADSRISA